MGFFEKSHIGWLPALLSLILAGWLSCFPAEASGSPPEVGKWRRIALPFSSFSYSGNPFELEFSAVFKHRESGVTLKLPGYFAGSNLWKIGFMPNRPGLWDYQTSSPDPGLNNRSGSVRCIPSGHPGLLGPDPGHPRKWKFADGNHVLPIALRLEFFTEPGTDEVFKRAALFMRDHHLLLLDTRLLEEQGQFEGGRHDFIFQGDWKKQQFDLTVWDRMERRMEILTELGLGAHLMFYSDDDGTPPWPAMSPTEKLVIRYTLARLAGFPVLLFNTGIDIDEYRDQTWVDWFGRQIRELDPYGHPVSSRYGGGSGEMVMKGQTFDSRGERFAKMADMVRYFKASGVPVSMDDAWGENRTRVSEKTFRPEDIRRAFWKCLAAGGLGGIIRGDDGYFHLHNLPEDLESEQWLKWINPFLQKELGRTFPVMVPDPTPAVNGFSLADPERTLIMILYLGKDDRWDPGPGGPLQIQGERLSGSYRARWFDPRTGKFTSAGLVAAGKLISLDPPSPEDWVLLLDRQNP